VFRKTICSSQFSHKSVNLFSVLEIVKDKLRGGGTASGSLVCTGSSSALIEHIRQPLYRDVKRFRGRLLFKAHRRWRHSTRLGSNTEEEGEVWKDRVRVVGMHQLPQRLDRRPGVGVLGLRVWMSKFRVWVLEFRGFWCKGCKG